MPAPVRTPEGWSPGPSVVSRHPFLLQSFAQASPFPFQPNPRAWRPERKETVSHAYGLVWCYLFPSPPKRSHRRHRRPPTRGAHLGQEGGGAEVPPQEKTLQLASSPQPPREHKGQSSNSQRQRSLPTLPPGLTPIPPQDRHGLCKNCMPCTCPPPPPTPTHPFPAPKPLPRAAPSQRTDGFSLT